MQNLDNQPKQRHGCVTAWLVLMIVVNAAAMFYSLISTSDNMSAYAFVIPRWIYLTLALISLCNVICAVMLLKWKKIAFWGFVVSSILTMSVNLYAGLGIAQSIVGLLGVCVLFAILQIKEGGKSAWENLD